MTTPFLPPKNAETFLEVTPIDKKKCNLLIDSFLIYQKEIKDKGLIAEVIPNFGLNLYVPMDSDKLAYVSEQDMKKTLTALGVGLLKVAKIEGSTELKEVYKAQKQIDHYSYEWFSVSGTLYPCKLHSSKYFE